MMITLIICTYNREEYIYTTLEKVAANDYPAERYEIVIVNNNCTDNTDALCRKFVEGHKELNITYCIETKQGLSHARNRGIEEAKGEMLVFLDDDAFVKTDYLAKLEKYLENHPEAVAFGGKITPLFESGKSPEWLCKWTYSWVSAIDKGNEVTKFGENEYPIGANMGIKREVFEKVGEFNSNLGRNKKNMIAGEEKDMFHRIRNIGSILYFPKIEVQHVIPESRTTKEYIERYGLGIGKSERIRCRDLGHGKLAKRMFSEVIKWGGTFVIGLKYAVMGRGICGKMLIVFRWNVTRGLLEL